MKVDDDDGDGFEGGYVYFRDSLCLDYVHITSPK